MKNHWLHIIILLLLISCGEELISKPDNLIPEDQMADIIQDMAIMNAAKSTNSNILRENKIDPTDFILKKHAVDSLQFVVSDRYYVSKPAVYQEIYKMVEERLKARGKLMGETKRIKDSVSLKNRLKEAGQKAKNLDRATDSLP